MAMVNHDFITYENGISHNVGKTRINHPCGNSFSHLFMVIWGMAYDCVNRMTYSSFGNWVVQITTNTNIYGN